MMDNDGWKPMLLVLAVGLFFAGREVYRLHQQGWPTWLLTTAVVAALVVLGAIGVGLRRLYGGQGDSRKAMQSGRSAAAMTGREARRRGESLRPSLAGADRRTEMAQYGSLLGLVGRTPAYASWEDVTVVFMGPRSNKTSAVAVPKILAAPGAVIATSNKPDLWMLTKDLRAQVGEVFVLDPQRIAYVEQTWWVNLLASVTDVESAERLAGHFMREVGGGSDRTDPFFTPAGGRVVQLLLLAAAVSGRTLRDVATWVETMSREPVRLLTDHDHGQLAESLNTTLEGPPETKGGIYATAAVALSCLSVESIARWITPPQTWRTAPAGEIRELDPWELVTPRTDGRYPTLYLLSREGAGTARVLVSAIVDRAFEVAGQAASAQGGRIDPPLTVMLDEAANVCRIQALPDLYSFFGSQGISVTTILQSYEQGVRVWGREGMDALWSASTVAIAGAGLRDVDFCKRLSDLIGDHEVDKRSRSSSSTGSSTSTSTQWEPIMRPAEISAMPKTHALLFVSGNKPVTLKLLPWYAEDDARAITDYAAAAGIEVTAAAVSYLGADNPLARALTAAPQERVAR